jgi:hypothetical protein
MAYATPTHETHGPVGEGDYIVESGDCVESVAARFGFHWETIWNDPKNAALRKARVSPNVLLPGDRLHIPEKILRTEDRPTEQRHHFILLGEPSKLRICVKQSGEPRSKQPYLLEIDGERYQGNTDEGGWIDLEIPADASEGKLTIGEHPLHRQAYLLELGGMDPVTEVVGVQKRLHNLGFSCQPTGELDSATTVAIAAFQQNKGLEPTGEIDRNLIDKLKTQHGS